VAFKKRCPWCKHVSKFDILEENVCQNCGASLENAEDKDVSVFKDSPVPQGYDRRIRSSK
jgi:rRNA maturation endonuclease Nob1